MSFPNKQERTQCWGTRDLYWECLDKNNVRDVNKDGICSEFRKAYENSCPLQWVKHFDRKRSYLKFKNRMETEGYEPLDDKKSK